MSKYGNCRYCGQPIGKNYSDKQFCDRDCYNKDREKNKESYRENYADKVFYNVISKHKEHLGVDNLKEWLEQKYLREKLSYRDIMKLLNTKNNRGIKKLLDYYNIPIRSGSEAVATQWINNDERRTQQSIATTKRFTGNTNRRLSVERLAKRYAKNNFTLLERRIVDDYTICLLECNECGNQIWRHQKNHNRGCIICMRGASKGESRVQEFLDSYNIPYEVQYTIRECRYKESLPFDFALFDKNKLIGLIEYQGEQHYKPVEFFGGEERFRDQQRNDGIKRGYCKTNDVPLIEIPYWEEDIEEFLDIKLNKLNINIQLAL